MSEKTKIKILRWLWYGTLAGLMYANFFFGMIKSPWWFVTYVTMIIMGIITYAINYRGDEDED